MSKTIYIDGKKVLMEEGQLYYINNKVYAICSECHQLVRVDKKIFGSLHICVK